MQLYGFIVVVIRRQLDMVFTDQMGFSHAQRVMGQVGMAIVTVVAWHLDMSL